MSLTRRAFLVNTTYTGAGLLVAGAAKPAMLWADAPAPSLAPYLTGMRMAATPATAYRAYRSKVVSNPEVTTWVQVDLGRSFPIEAVHLFPASERMFPGRDQYYAGEGFPLRFRIEASDDASFAIPMTIADFTHSDFPDPKDNITQYSQHGVSGRYVRLTATRLRAVSVRPDDGVPMGGDLKDSPDFTLTLAKMAVLSGGKDVAVGCKVAADPEHGNAEHAGQITRPPREDGEGIHYDRPHAVTNPSTWKAAKYQAVAPRSGVTLDGGLFQTAMENNIEYLLTSYSTDDLLRQFYERAGKIRNFKPVGSQIFWEEGSRGGPMPAVS